MSNYIIATSSTSDLPRTWLDQHQIPFIAYTYTVGEEVFEDDCREESRQKVYESMRKGAFLKTAMINEYTYMDFFRSLMQDGKNVIFLDMSQKMSASYTNCMHAAEEIRKEFPEQTLYVMDTLCISGGLGLLVESMVLRMEDGMSFEDVIAWGEANKLKIAHRFTVDDLKYLKMGGRVSNASALVGSLLNIKPVLYVPDGGTLDVVKKARGRKAALQEIISGVLHDLSRIDPTDLTMHILHADCKADAETVEAAVRKAYPMVGRITITQLGVVIGAHCGPGLLTVFYLCDGRHPA